MSPVAQPSVRRRRPPVPAPTPRERFRGTDAYRAGREWSRYEGTPQRDLFRGLRRRFLERWTGDVGWALDAGAGPGRFTPFVGGPATRRIALDLSPAMLAEVPRAGTATPDGVYPAVERIVGDIVRPPFPPGAFRLVAALGNLVGFAGPESDRAVDALESLVAPGGRLLIEIAPGPGERSTYLGRLPVGAVRRLLRAPPAVVLPRVRREGFRRAPVRHRSVGFARWTVATVLARLGPPRWERLEVAAVAPCLGLDAERITAVRPDPKGWARLLDLEEAVGREPERWAEAAAVLVALRRPSGAHD